MTREIRISLTLPGDEDGVSATVAPRNAAARRRSEIAASIRRALDPMPPALRELRAAELARCPDVGAPLFTAVLRGDPASSASAGVELLNALTHIDDPLELDVTFVPER